MHVVLRLSVRCHDCDVVELLFLVSFAPVVAVSERRTASSFDSVGRGSFVARPSAFVSFGAA